jgi:hypothetical protein
MPAYSFQERFIPFILDGSKDHTVRRERSGRSRHVRPGETIQLYYGMRTKWCRKIGEAICKEIHRILIREEGMFLSSYFGDDPALSKLWLPFNKAGCDRFAWRDGFRPEGLTFDNPAGAWDLMLRWWRQTHELPFQGVVIYWKDFRPIEEFKVNNQLVEGDDQK